MIQYPRYQGFFIKPSCGSVKKCVSRIKRFGRETETIRIQKHA